MTTDVLLRLERADDHEFLAALYATTREDELKPVPWSDSQKHDFLRMQFELQTTYYRQHYSDAAYQIILLGEKEIGRLYIHRGKDHVLVIDIALLPEHRGTGIGGRLMRNVLSEAAADRKRVRIHVERDNRALSLYTRLGFELLENEGVYYLMEWKPERQSEIAGAAR
jgi:ribosomal protein S18 acetylase RimI-like enzyme